MHIKWGTLVVIISCMGTALAMAISGQDDTPIVGAVEKNHAPSSKSSADKTEQAQTDTHFDLTGIKRTVPDKIQNSGLFQSKSWYVPPPSPPASLLASHASLSPPSPPPPPSAPQLPFTFLGRMIDGNEVTLYLSKGNQQYSAKLSDTLEGTYRVDKITDKRAVFTYLPLNIQQDLVFNSTAIGISALSASEIGTLMQPQQQSQLIDLSR